jgi:hypothetical protein
LHAKKGFAATFDNIFAGERSRSGCNKKDFRQKRTFAADGEIIKSPVRDAVMGERRKNCNQTQKWMVGKINRQKLEGCLLNQGGRGGNVLLALQGSCRRRKFRKEAEVLFE